MKANPVSVSRGSVMLYVLVVVALISLVFVGWLELMSNRAQTVEIQVYNMKRRLAYENGRALLRQYLVSEVPGKPPSTEIGAVSASLSDGWGTLSIAAWDKTPIGDWVDPQTDSNLLLGSMTGWFTSAAGSAMTATISTTVDLAEEGGSASTIAEPVSVVLHTRTWGDIGAYVAANGASSVDATAAHAAGVAPLWYVCDGAGAVTVYLDPSLDTAIPLAVSVTNATSLTMVGSAVTAVTNPVIYVDQSASATLATVTFSGSNAREFYLAVKNPLGAVRMNLDFAAGSSWVMTSVWEDTAVQLRNAPGSLFGYILTNGSFLPADTVNLRPNGWDEVYGSYP